LSGHRHAHIDRADPNRSEVDIMNRTQGFLDHAVLIAAFAIGAGCAADGGHDHDATSKAAVEEKPSAGERLYELRFAPVVHDQPFACTQQFHEMGMGKTKIRPLDFRLWTHGFVMVTSGGQEIPLRLKQDHPTRTIADDGAWQKDGHALLDFEDASGTCVGTTETRMVVRGFASARDDWAGVKFKVGVKRARNNIEAAVAEYPFGAPGMAWQWKGGYRFVRIDVSTLAKDKYYFHLGSTACEGEVAGGEHGGGINCKVENVASIALSGFHPDRNQIVADMATIYAGIDMDSPDDKNYACMSGGTKSTMCPSMFGAFGLPFADYPPPAGATFFRTR
jgi:uncharacterized repeat protein (TIGR04052 family)